MNEIFKDIAGYEGLYQVSNLGQVRSLKSGETKNLKPRNNKGYLLVNLSKDGKTKTLLVHRLVAKAFIPNPQNLPCVNHKDEDKTNNAVSNLEFCSVRYNNCYGSVLKRRAAKKSKSVLQYDEDGKLVKTWPSTQEVQRQLGFSQGNICNCCNGKRESANGFVWRYEK